MTPSLLATSPGPQGADRSLPYVLAAAAATVVDLALLERLHLDLTQL